MASTVHATCQASVVVVVLAVVVVVVIVVVSVNWFVSLTAVVDT